MKPSSKPSKKSTPKGSEEASSPTMIIPRGTEIEVDAHGQLSIRAPGNLVIQNSGAYGHLESLAGSIRIDHNVEVEAVTVRCADTCFVQGSLTAWKVDAQALHVEETAQAQVVLQETEHLEIGREARVVGNFESEKELFLLFSRFAREVRSLPFYFERKGTTPEIGDGEVADDEEAVVEAEAGNGDRAPESREEDASRQRSGDGGTAERAVRGTTSTQVRQDLPEDLFFALVLLERDAAREEYGPTSQRVLQEILKLLQERDLETLRHTWRTLFGRIIEPRQDVRRAQELIAAYYGEGDEPSAPEDDEGDETRS